MARRRKKKSSKEVDQMQSAGIFCAQRKMRGIIPVPLIDHSQSNTSNKKNRLI